MGVFSCCKLGPAQPSRLGGGFFEFTFHSGYPAAQGAQTVPHFALGAAKRRQVPYLRTVLRRRGYRRTRLVVICPAFFAYSAAPGGLLVVFVKILRRLGLVALGAEQLPDPLDHGWPRSSPKANQHRGEVVLQLREKPGGAVAVAP
jgi:hypothetical protein